MAESKTTRINIDKEMPVGYKSLSGIEISKKNVVNGIIKLGTRGNSVEKAVQDIDPLQMWGFDTPEHLAEFERNRLFIRVGELEDRLAELESVNERLSERNSELEELNRALWERLQGAGIDPAEEVKPAAATEVVRTPEEEAVIVDEPEVVDVPAEEPVIVSGTQGSGSGSGAEVITESETPWVETEPRATVVAESATEPSVVAPPSTIRPSIGQRFRMWRNRDKYYDERTGVEYTVDDQGERIYENKRSGIGTAVGAIAIAAALIYGGWLHHEVEELEHGQADAELKADNNFANGNQATNEKIEALGVKITRGNEGLHNQVKAAKKQLSDQMQNGFKKINSDIEEFKAQEKAEQDAEAQEQEEQSQTPPSTDVYNTYSHSASAPDTYFYGYQYDGSRYAPKAIRPTGVNLSKEFKMIGKPGAYKIIDAKTGTVLVSKVKWTSKGVLTPDIINSLKFNNYNISYGNFGRSNYFASSIWTK